MDNLKISRMYFVDFIKFFSTVLIVLQHSVSNTWTTVSVNTFQWQVINFLFMLSRFAVPLFIMCSGVGMLSRERTLKELWKNNIFSLLKVYASWMLIYGLIDVIGLYQSGYGIRVMFNAVVKDVIFGHYHTWFIAMLIGLYMITPFIYTIIQKQENLIYYIVLSLLFTVLLPIIYKFESLSRLYHVIDDIHMNFVVGYSLYFVLGYWIANNKFKQKFILVQLIILIGIAYFTSIIYSSFTGNPEQWIYGEFSPITILICVLLMIYCKEKESIIAKHLKKITSLSKYGIAIYLMHPLFLCVIPKNAGYLCIVYGLLIWVSSLILAVLIGKIAVLNRIFLK